MEAENLNNAKTPALQQGVSRSFSSEELHGLWQFANAQYLMIKEKHEESDNHVEIMCFAFTANCIINIMDEIVEMLEPSENCG